MKSTTTRMKKSLIARLGALGVIATIGVMPVISGDDYALASVADCGLLVDGFHQVSTAAQLQNVGAEGEGTGACQLGASYKQVQNITLPSPGSILTDGQSNGPSYLSGDFTGVYDGQGFSITGFTSNNRSFFVGRITTATAAPRAVVKNVRFVDLAATSFSERGALATSILNADIENVHLEGEITVGGSNKVGGFAMLLEGDSIIRNSSTDLEISKVAGLSNRQYIGGIVSEIEDTSQILGSWSTGNFVDIDSSTGGLVGEMDHAQTLISRSWSSVNITASGGQIGGLVGEVGGEIRFSYASGRVSSTQDPIGGLIGVTDGNDSAVRDSYASGQVAVDGDDERAGGLIGNLRGLNRVVQRSLATSYPQGVGVSDKTGALAGNNGLTDADFNDVANPSLATLANLSANFFDNSSPAGLLGVANTVDLDAPGAAGKVTGLPTAQLQSFATFDGAGWAIVDGWAPFDAPDTGPVDPETDKVWGICSGVNGGYPFLLWQYTSNPCPSASPGVVSPAIHLDLKAKAGDVVAGAPVLIEGQGLRPGSTYSLVMRSTPTTVTTGTVSSGGRFSTTVNLPSGIAPGNHTITLTAIGSDGSTLSLVTTFVVSSTGTFTSISPGVGSVVGGLAATGPDSSALSLGVASSLAVLALGLAVLVSSRRKTARAS